MSERRKTTEVRIGGVVIGGDHPIAIQSMTVSDTNDVAASSAEVIRLATAGASIVRLTVPSMKAADAMARIRERVRGEGCDVPLVADIHYTPNAAQRVAAVVEKVRVNPGNFVDRPGKNLGGVTFEEGAARVAEIFGRLVETLKEHRVALRVGVNHGSLSERMTSRYGDSPEGMVESALEYVAVCETHGFRDVVVSLKSSIPAVTVAANRLFAQRADRAGWRTPLHVGVTEAGMGDEGLLRSASGIGTLLAEGIGDTIRVSLTGDPATEIPAARRILDAAGVMRGMRRASGRPGVVRGRETEAVRIGPSIVGGDAPVAVLAPLVARPARGGADRSEEGPGAGFEAGEPPDIVIAGEGVGEEPRRGAAPGKGVLHVARTAADIVRLAQKGADAVWFVFDRGDCASSAAWSDAAKAIAGSGTVPVVTLSTTASPGRAGDTPGRTFGALLDDLLDAMPGAFDKGALVAAAGALPIDTAPALEMALARRKLRWPHLLVMGGEEDVLADVIALSPPLLDGIGHAVAVRAAPGAGSDAAAERAWRLLQATRRRLIRIEYISCPSCGRTLFDLDEVTGAIRNRTSHLKNVKVAVMGCIVNGPGEMADADFGYVGSGPGKIDLYVGREKVMKNVPEGDAVERLVHLIRERGAWSEPCAPGDPIGPSAA